MKLHTRLLFAYGYLVALVLLGAAGAALGFLELGNRIGTMLDDNFESVRTSMEMLEALERQDSAVLAALLEGARSSDEVAISERAFLDALARARGNVTEETERPVLDSIATRYGEYRGARDLLLSSASESPLAEYESEFFPKFESVKEDVRRLLDLNHRAMRRADRDAQATAARRALGYAVLTALALLSMGWLSHSLRVNVIARFEELRSVAQAIGRGDFRRRASEQHTDELGSVARALNGLLDAQEELRGSASAGGRRLVELALARLQAENEAAALISLGGDLLISTFGDVETAAIGEIAGRLRSELPEDLAAAGPVERRVDDQGGLRFRLLVVNRKRAVGWWVDRPVEG
jgi:HAMP domain-containing protein